MLGAGFARNRTYSRGRDPATTRPNGNGPLLLLIALTVFRIAAYAVRWLFPLIELEGSRSKTVRATGSAVVIGLFTDLDALTREVTGAQIDGVERPAGVQPAAFALEQQQAKAEAGLALWVYGKNGEQVALHSAAAITREALPDRLTNITFDSGARFRMKLNVDPVNRFRLNFDFTEPVLFVGYDPWNQPTPNGTRLEVIGANQTWVAGVCDRVLNFLKARKRSRRWLHEPTTFSLFNWLVGFPASFWLVYRVDTVTQRLTAGLPGVIRSGFYVYLLLIALTVFRTPAYRAYGFPDRRLRRALALPTHRTRGKPKQDGASHRQCRRDWPLYGARL